LRKELAFFGGTVNAISPSTEMPRIQSSPADQRAQLEALIFLGHVAPPAEIAASGRFPGSEEAGYIIGIVLPVDGGVAM
jgi:3-oxoacyl-[acyl-carrier protein] reductase